MSITGYLIVTKKYRNEKEFSNIIALLLTATLQGFAGEIKIKANLTGFTDTAVVYLLSGQTPIAYQTLGQGKVELTAEVSETPDTYTIYVIKNNQPYYTMLFVAKKP